MAKDISALETKLREGRSKIDSIELVLSILEFRSKLVKPAEYLPQSLLSTDEPTAVSIFLSRYIIAIVRDFANSPSDYDIILAAYGFLDGYECPEVQKRHIQYCQDVGTHKFGKDTPLNVHWPADDIDKSLNTKENSAIKKLAKRLESEMVKRGGALGYDAEAEKLLGKPFPLPNYLLGNGYRKCEIKNRIFYVPLTERESRSLANQSVKKIASSSSNAETNSDNLSKNAIAEDEQDITSDIDAAEDKMPGNFQSKEVCLKFPQTDHLDSVKNNEPNIASDKDDIRNSLYDGLSPTIIYKESQSKQSEGENKIKSENEAFKNSRIENTVPESGQTEKQAKEDKILQEKGESIEEIRKKSPTEPTPSTDKAIRFAGELIAGSIIAGSIIIGVAKPIIIENANAYKEIMSSVIPAENPSLAEDIPVIEAMLIEAESFKVKDIDEENRIDVVPDITKKLTIELEPQDADMSTLKFESSSPKMVNAEYGYITAYSEEMEVGKSYVVDITITAIKTDYKEVIHVMVESPEMPDDVDGAVFGGSQK